MLFTITKRTVLRAIIRNCPENGRTMGEMQLRFLRIGDSVNERHLNRFRNVIQTLIRKKWIYTEQDDKQIVRFLPTDDGKAWMKNDRRAKISVDTKP